MVRFFMVFSLKSLTNEDSCQVCKDESLYECNQYFNDINKHDQCDKEGRSAVTKCFTHLTKNENEADKTQHDNVTGSHVRK